MAIPFYSREENSQEENNHHHHNFAPNVNNSIRIRQNRLRNIQRDSDLLTIFNFNTNINQVGHQEEYDCVDSQVLSTASSITRRRKTSITKIIKTTTDTETTSPPQTQTNNNNYERTTTYEIIQSQNIIKFEFDRKVQKCTVNINHHNNVDDLEEGRRSFTRPSLFLLEEASNSNSNSNTNTFRSIGIELRNIADDYEQQSSRENKIILGKPKESQVHFNLNGNNNMINKKSSRIYSNFGLVMGVSAVFATIALGFIYKKS